METQALLKKFSGQLMAPHLQPRATPPEADITIPSFLSHQGQKVNCNPLFLSIEHRSILNKFFFLPNMIISFGDYFQTRFKKWLGMKDTVVHYSNELRSSPL